ncbi:hypothetical protein NDU88_000917 [Pleurodeles waltl]|uniref:Uncharacterized protein n=1 Tax=Pleurodeles waltl TaxID=8319 RepID=A0AAV7MK96_PLEWA|nr:hypothetical protein NDU88_000917 [Pleurodeles waltl]
MGPLRSGTGSSSQALRPEALTSNGHKLDAVLAAVERIGAALDQTQTSLENKLDKVTIDLNLLYADHLKLVDKTRLLEGTLSDLAHKTNQMDASRRELADRDGTGAPGRGREKTYMKE